MASENIFWRDPALGEPTTLETSGGPMRAFSAGTGEPIVFCHGALVNSNLWRKVVARLSPDFRCVSLELPLGSHELPMPDANLTPTGLADLIAEAVGKLGLESPTLVGNDSGGALCQLLAARHPDVPGRLVLTSCDVYEKFPPRFFQFVLWPTRYPALARALFAPLRLRPLRETPLAFGWLMHSKLDERAGDSYVLPALTHAPAGEDFARFVRAVDPDELVRAAERLRAFERPVLVAWSSDDRFFPREDAQRLASEIPNARFELIEGARTFSPEDQPERLAELIAGFVREPVPA